MRNKPDYPLRSVDNALTLIRLLRDRGPLRLTDASAALGISRSTAHRLLAMLEYHGFAHQDPDTRAYAAGTGQVDLRAAARPALEALRAEVGETVHLVALRDADVEFVDSVETAQGLRVGSRVGIRMPAHCTAAGKAILAGLTPDELRRRYPSGRLERMTTRSLPSLKRLEAELAAVRERGYATNFAESEADVAAVAVAIPGAEHSITVSAPVTRLAPDRAPAIAAAATRAVAAIPRE
jgi:IclR family transcriptional regulator, acetate operon repressor